VPSDKIPTPRLGSDPASFIPGQADTTQTIPGFFGNNSLDFIQYNGTTLDSGFALGVQGHAEPRQRQLAAELHQRSSGNRWNDTLIARITTGTDNATVTTTLTTSRALDAIKVEVGGTNRIREFRHRRLPAPDRRRRHH
jgi:hypothetical protein